jgi:type II secretory pathway predicted ATPase ExeA
MTQNNNKRTQNALQFFGFRYPPFADTFEITNPYRSDAEKLMIDRIDALLRQGKSLAICGDAGTGKSMFIKTITSLLDTKPAKRRRASDVRCQRSEEDHI